MGSTRNKWCQRQAVQASTTYAVSGSVRVLSLDSSAAVDTQRPWDGKREPNT
jgi:hypothetical protein